MSAAGSGVVVVAATRTPPASAGSELHTGICQPGSGNLELGFPWPVPRGSGGGTLPGGARVPQAEECRRLGDRSWALSPLVTKHEGAALGGGGREPGVPGTVWSY